MARRKRVLRRWRSHLLRELEQFLLRISREPRDRLAWVVALVQQAPGEMTDGDRANLRGELGAFLSLGAMGLAGESLRPGTAWFASLRKAVFMAPLPEEIPGILTRLGRIIEQVVKRESIRLEEQPGTVELSWVDGFGRWLRSEVGKLDMANLAGHALTPLILAFGHLVRECPAPDLRAKADETCGVWFVAKRPNQDYCSATCQSRATTRAKRAGTPTAASLKRREAR